jgi:hypothetical protein
MNANLQCIAGHRFEVRNLNLLRMQTECPVCGTDCMITQALERMYGKEVGKVARDVMDALDRLASKPRDLTLDVARGDLAIELAIQRALQLAPLI